MLAVRLCRAVHLAVPWCHALLRRRPRVLRRAGQQAVEIRVACLEARGRAVVVGLGRRKLDAARAPWTRQEVVVGPARRARIASLRVCPRAPGAALGARGVEGAAVRVLEGAGLAGGVSRVVT
jgi:hypothetical protein